MLAQERTRTAARVKELMSGVFFEIEARVQAEGGADGKDAAETLTVVRQVIKEQTKAFLSSAQGSAE